MPVSQLSAELPLEPLIKMAGSSRWAWQSIPPGCVCQYTCFIMQTCERGMYHHTTTLSIDDTRGIGIGKGAGGRKEHNLLIFDSNVPFRNIAGRGAQAIGDDKVVFSRHLQRSLRMCCRSRVCGWMRFVAISSSNTT